MLKMPILQGDVVHTVCWRLADPCLATPNIVLVEGFDLV